MSVTSKTRSIPVPSDPDLINERFLQFQFFTLIYLQKFAIGPSTFALSLPMLVMFVGLIWMAAKNRLLIAKKTCALFLIFLSSCLLSLLLSHESFSIPSFAELILLYACMIVRLPLSHPGYLRVLDKFITFMIVPACIIIFQYVFQKATGQSNPLSMNRLLPDFLLMPGFYYEAPYPWDSTFMRPNGFFFLEPSFASAFAATAAILEMTYFRRTKIVCLMLAATFLSLGGTGFTMLVIAFPFLIIREQPKTILFVVAVALCYIIIALSFGLPLPMTSRLEEFDNPDSSGSGRLLQPAQELLTLLGDPGHFITGSGPGAVSSDEISAWPTVKVGYEYSLIAAILYFIFLTAGESCVCNIPLKAALFITYQFTGAYLLNPIMVLFVAVFCFIMFPIWPRVAEKQNDLLHIRRNG